MTENNQNGKEKKNQNSDYTGEHKETIQNLDDNSRTLNNDSESGNMVESGDLNAISSISNTFSKDHENENSFSKQSYFKPPNFNNEIIGDDVNENVEEISTNLLTNNMLLDKEDFHYKQKLEELDSLKEDYDLRYNLLKGKIEEYDTRNDKLLEKRKDLETMVEHYEAKNKILDERIKELTDRNESLEEAREQFRKLSDQFEIKKQELEHKQKELKITQKSLEKSKYEIEKAKLEMEESKLSNEIDMLKEKDLEKVEESIEDNAQDKKSKNEALNDILTKLVNEGYIISSFLVDSNGMLISESLNKEFNPNAVGAMFSLLCTTIIRTITNLNLYKLQYFKLSSLRGDFLLSHIDIENYNRSLILIAYYDNSKVTFPKLDEQLRKKAFKRIIKSVKKDFSEIKDSNKINWIFENLMEKISFLKKKYMNIEENIDELRIKSLNTASVKIKQIFEK